MGTARFSGQAEGSPTDRFPCVHKTWISDELPYGSQQRLDLFHIDLKTPFLQVQSGDVNRDVVCQLPPEASHPPNIAARLKKPAYGMNDATDAGGTSLTRHCVAMAWFPHEPIDAVSCCIRYCRVSELGNTWDREPSHSSMAQETSLLNRASDQKWRLHVKKR